jgi:hypothetical protein
LNGVEAPLPDKDAAAVEILKILRDCVAAIPTRLVNETEQLRAADPELFEETLVRGVQLVGFGFYPASATEFVEVLNRPLHREMACP